MRYFYLLGLFLFLVAFGLAGLWLMQNNSPLTLNWLGYEIRTSVAFVALTLFAFTLVLVFICYGFLWVIGLPSRALNKMHYKRVHGGLDMLTRGFIAYSSGDHATAQKLTAKASKKLHEQPLLTTILSAEIARASGDAVGMKQHYTALLNHKETEYLGLKGLIYQAQKEKDYGTLVSLSEKAKKLKPKDMWLNAVLLSGYKHQRRWEEAEGELDQLVRALKKRPELKDQLPADVHEADFSRQKGILLYQRARDLAAKHQFRPAGECILQAIRYMPDFAPAYVLGAQILPQAGSTRKLRKLIEEAWAAAPHPDMARALALVMSNEGPERRLRAAEKLLDARPEHPESHKAVAVAAIAAGDFSLARNHVKAALQIQETPSICLLMGHLAKLENDLEQVEAWKKRATLASPDPLWVCDHCHHATQHWDISCSSCGSWDSYAWSQPEDGTVTAPDALLLVDAVTKGKDAASNDGVRAWRSSRSASGGL